MNKHSEKYIASQLNVLAPVLTEAGKTCEDLVLYLKESGARTKWSAHTKMGYEHRFNLAQNATTTLSNALTLLFPKHWKMDNYGIRLNRDGKSMRLCGKQGKAQGGITCGTTIGDAYFLAGYLVGAIAASKENDRPVNDRLKSLDIDIKKVNTYSFWSKAYNGSLSEYKGFTPRDAAAHAHAAGHLYSKGDWTTLDTPEQAFNFGATRAARLILGELPTWSIMPTLWRKLTKHPSMRSLYRESLTYDYGRAPWRECKELKTRETLFAAAIRLLPLFKTGKKKDWLVVTSSASNDVISAWCPASALVRAFLDDIKLDTLPYEFAKWQVWPMTAEAGTAARAAMDISPQKRPPRPHQHEKEKRMLAWTSITEKNGHFRYDDDYY